MITYGNCYHKPFFFPRAGRREPWERVCDKPSSQLKFSACRTGNIFSRFWGETQVTENSRRLRAPLHKRQNSAC